MPHHLCPHPKRCAEEALWMHYPHASGWNEVSANRVNGRQAEGYFFRGMLVLGNTVCGDPAAITIDGLTPQPTARKWWEFWK